MSLLVWNLCVKMPAQNGAQQLDQLIRRERKQKLLPQSEQSSALTELRTAYMALIQQAHIQEKQTSGSEAKTLLADLCKRQQFSTTVLSV